jgi:ABC-type nitrate/sulfonate/bicarbonate transport system ATPase subunit
LQRATLGGVLIDGKDVTSPGVERAVVFQASALLPWLSARANVALALETTFREALAQLAALDSGSIPPEFLEHRRHVIDFLEHHARRSRLN